jgi:Flp pilus assembly pilin Flp
VRRPSAEIPSGAIRGGGGHGGWAGQVGQGLVEYGLILGLAAMVTVVALVFFGGALATALSLIGQAIDAS